MTKIKNIIIVLLFICKWSHAQFIEITPNFSTETYFPYSKIWDIDVQLDTPPDKNYYFIQAEVKNETQELLFISRTQAFLLSPELTPYNIIYHLNETGNLEYEWKNQSFYTQMQKSGGFLPPGNYEITYRLLSTTKGCNWAGQLIYHFTTYLTIDYFNLLDLISPFDKDTLTTNIPNFVWVPLTPNAENVRYTIKIVQITNGLTAEESINTNIPVYEEAGLSATNHLYPTYARLLTYNMTYAWQVTAIVNHRAVAYSPVYTFYLAGDNNSKPTPKNDPFYIELKPQQKAQYITINDEYIYISYYLQLNSEGILNYAIINSETGEEVINSELEPMIFGQGKNLYQIDISRLSDKKQYQLIVKGIEQSDVRSLFFYLNKN